MLTVTRTESKSINAAFPAAATGRLDQNAPGAIEGTQHGLASPNVSKEKGMQPGEGMPGSTPAKTGSPSYGSAPMVKITPAPIDPVGNSGMPRKTTGRSPDDR